MTQIVSGCKTKKELKHAALVLNQGGSLEDEPMLYDPSIFTPMRGGDIIRLQDVEEYERWTVTNHPKRSWFAKVERVNGKLVVS